MSLHLVRAKHLLQSPFLLSSSQTQNITLCLISFLAQFHLYGKCCGRCRAAMGVIYNGCMTSLKGTARPKKNENCNFLRTLMSFQTTSIHLYYFVHECDKQNCVQFVNKSFFPIRMKWFIQVHKTGLNSLFTNWIDQCLV